MKFKVGQKIKIHYVPNDYNPDQRAYPWKGLSGTVKRIGSDGNPIVAFLGWNHWCFYPCNGPRSDHHKHNECYCMLKPQYKWEDL